MMRVGVKKLLHPAAREKSALHSRLPIIRSKFARVNCRLRSRPAPTYTVRT
jgi:hypothetical protein